MRFFLVMETVQIMVFFFSNYRFRTGSKSKLHLKKMVLHQIIDLTGDETNNITVEEPEVEIVYENVSQETGSRIEPEDKKRSPGGRSGYRNTSLFNYKVVNDRNKYEEQKLNKYKEYLIKEYWNLHKFNRCQKIKKSKSKMLKLAYQTKGYKILTKWGWKPDEGLGIRKQGIKYPIEVEQLTHKMGLGNKN